MKSIRIPSIDVFRGLTMLLMIFVNDLWTLRNIPYWLEHAEAHVDFLGVADVVFPCFLFILGMAIPLAIDTRLQKGDSPGRIAVHILWRTLALLIMGVFTVNVPDLNPELTGLSSEWFQIWMVIGFFLIWNVYPQPKMWVVSLSQGIGIVLLLVLAYQFKAGTAAEPVGFLPLWWGILGLIGWSYGASALVYLWFRRSFLALVLSTILCLGCTILAHAGVGIGTISMDGFLLEIGIGSINGLFLGNGAFHAFTLAGVCTVYWIRNTRPERILWGCLIAGVVCIGAGLVSRQFFIISKIQATPTWVLLCIGISLLVYGLLHWLIDQKQKQHWFRWLEPAGTLTLTCYLIPYLLYSLTGLTDLSLPEWALTGLPGLLKSFAFAWLVIGIAALFRRIGIRLKI